MDEVNIIKTLKNAKQVKLKLSNEQRKGSASMQLFHLKASIIFMTIKFKLF